MIAMSVNGTAHDIRFVPPALRVTTDDDTCILMCQPAGTSRVRLLATERFPCGNQACRIPVDVSVESVPRAYRDDMLLMCISCALIAYRLDGAGGTRLLDEQRAALRNLGLTDDDIARALAAANRAFEAGTIAP